MALLDSRALSDPFIGGVHPLGHIVVGDHPRRQIAAGSSYHCPFHRSGSMGNGSLGSGFTVLGSEVLKKVSILQP
jgi:hypothetical protein